MALTAGTVAIVIAMLAAWGFEAKGVAFGGRARQAVPAAG
jgi:hypothetical protein